MNKRGEKPAELNNEETEPKDKQPQDLIESEDITRFDKAKKKKKKKPRRNEKGIRNNSAADSNNGKQ